MSIFKACDIRGVYPDEVNEEIFYKIGVVLGRKLEGKKTVIAGDIRNSTAELKEALIEGLIKSDTEIVDIGILPTPVFYFAKDRLNAYGGLIVTASHNPPEYNGLKLMLGKMPVTKKDILEIEEEIQQLSLSDFDNTKNRGKLTANETLIEQYCDYIFDLLPAKSANIENIKVVIDAGNGTCSQIAPGLFTDRGYRVERLFCDFDGNFPNRSPNPAVKENLTRLQEEVLARKADLGVGFDGDGDRVVFVDEKGRVIDTDKSIVLFINEIVGKKESVVFDLKCSSIVPEAVEKQGGIPVMEKSGHAFIKRRLLEQNARFAGEISGHFFYRELGRDDGIYAALLMSEILSNRETIMSEMVDEIPQYISTPDLRITYKGNREQLLARIENNFDETQIKRVDGIRVDFTEGWGLIRKSITEPCVTLRFEAKEETDLTNIISLFLDQLPEIKKQIIDKIDDDIIANN